MPSGMTQISTISHRYATALFELALENKELTKTTKDVTDFQSLLKKNDSLRKNVIKPSLSSKKQEEIVKSVAEKAKYSNIVQNFLRLVCQNQRLPLIDHIIDSFQEKIVLHRSEITAKVISAVALTKTQEKTIVTALEKISDAKVKLQSIVDPALLGGLVIKIGSRLIDNSIQTQLLRLEHAMKGRC